MRFDFDQVRQQIASGAIDQSQWLDLIGLIQRRSGFAMLVMTRGDAESTFQDIVNESIDPENDVDLPDEPPEMSDELWSAVQGTWAWSKGFSESPIMDDAWALVRDAVTDGLGDNDTTRLRAHLVAGHDTVTDAPIDEMRAMHGEYHDNADRLAAEGQLHIWTRAHPRSSV